MKKYTQNKEYLQNLYKELESIEEDKKKLHQRECFVKTSLTTLPTSILSQESVGRTFLECEGKTSTYEKYFHILSVNDESIELLVYEAYTIYTSTCNIYKSSLPFISEKMIKSKDVTNGEVHNKILDFIDKRKSGKFVDIMSNITVKEFKKFVDVNHLENKNIRIITNEDSVYIKNDIDDVWTNIKNDNITCSEFINLLPKDESKNISLSFTEYEDSEIFEGYYMEMFIMSIVDDTLCLCTSYDYFLI